MRAVILWKQRSSVPDDRDKRLDDNALFLEAACHIDECRHSDVTWLTIHSGLGIRYSRRLRAFKVYFTNRWGRTHHSKRIYPVEPPTRRELDEAIAKAVMERNGLAQLVESLADEHEVLSPVRKVTKRPVRMPAEGLPVLPPRKANQWDGFDVELSVQDTPMPDRQVGGAADGQANIGARPTTRWRMPVVTFRRVGVRMRTRARGPLTRRGTAVAIRRGRRGRGKLIVTRRMDIKLVDELSEWFPFVSPLPPRTRTTVGEKARDITDRINTDLRGPKLGIRWREGGFVVLKQALQPFRPMETVGIGRSLDGNRIEVAGVRVGAMLDALHEAWKEKQEALIAQAARALEESVPMQIDQRGSRKNKPAPRNHQHPPPATVTSWRS
ncbi:unnamed protein product [Vitrella brassicaformis CCMP3155]|uniref:Uncharacterized protein n=1 Tax=Vitrella brassicaformis (strain CCMP3155) TaxID=1169540 RepID=A0A0G4GFN9_VITBC|nr:unnamed protein product [Vitrella brassicaformis CCMP3155]|eukprot:CEM28116.1 unnamed protein product [Vitrella brassicaformis CCMP3155]